MSRIEKKKFRLRPLSPIHIGSNTVIEPYEYFVKDNVLYKVNMEKVLQIDKARRVLKEKSFSLKELRKGLYEVYEEKYLSSELNQIIEYQIPVTPKIQSEFNAGINNPGKIGQQEILLLLRNPRPYIPASSIKGAIRTAVLNELVQSRENCRPVRKAKDLEHCILDAQRYDNRKQRYKNEFSKDPFQYLRLPDVEVEKMTQVVYAERVSLSNPRGNGIPSMKEVWIKGEVEFEVSFDVERYNRAGRNSKKGIGRLDDIFYYTGQFYKRKLDAEIERIKSGNISAKDDVLSELNKISLIGQSDIDIQALIRIGWGSGYDCMTIEELRNMKNPWKARPGKGWGFSMNIVEQRRPLGWAVLEEV